MDLDYYNNPEQETIERFRRSLDPISYVEKAPPHRKNAELFLYLASQYDRTADVMRNREMVYPEKEMVIDTLRLRAEEFRNLVDEYLVDLSAEQIEHLLSKYTKALDEVTKLVATWLAKNLT
jgi:hypothetical protein